MSVINSSLLRDLCGSAVNIPSSPELNRIVPRIQFPGCAGSGTLQYLFGDHLGSTSLVTDSSFNSITEQRYGAWGSLRYTAGAPLLR
jgi:hypothetical protein